MRREGAKIEKRRKVKKTKERKGKMQKRKRYEKSRERGGKKKKNLFKFPVHSPPVFILNIPLSFFSTLS